MIKRSVFSDEYNQVSGTNQGDIISPLNFILFLAMYLPKFKSRALYFVDDLKLFVMITNKEINKLHDDLRSLGIISEYIDTYQKERLINLR